MLNFVTVNWRNYQGRGAEYVNNLFDAVRRNLAEGTEGRFTVFTDDPHAGYREGIETQPLPGTLSGWWNKLYLFKKNLFEAGDRVVFFDLDTVITGPIDKIANYDGAFAILTDFYRPEGMQSSVMSWRAGEQTGIWSSYERAGCPMNDPGGDQAWIEKHCCSAWTARWQALFPGLFVSYKLTTGIPNEASVVVFHGKPRPHEVVTGWVPKVWKEGGLSRAELTAVCNTETDILLSNVRSAAARDLKWFTPSDEHDGHVAILGGGPSLVDKIDEIKWRQSIGQTVWVLNNAHAALKDVGIHYDAQVLLDARLENVEFLTEADEYMVASQCAPVMFGALRGQSVTLWHVNSPGVADVLADEKERPAYLVGGGTTVGMNALALAFLKGYRKIHLYGFDSCYRDGSHHAYAQPLNDGERASEALYGDQLYFCAPWMIGQAQEFIELAPGYIADGAIITVHGTGLLPDIGRDMLGILSPPQQRASEIMKRIPAGAVGVEIGVFAGQTSRELLKADPGLRLTMVDSWEGSGAAYGTESGDWHAALRQESQDDFMRQALKRVAFAGDRATVIRKRSTDAAADVPDASCDFVFIDADHSYDGCRADIAAWRPKIKAGGWICGHDYENMAFPKFGVTQAVDEFVAQNALQLELGANFCWFVKL